MPGDVVDEDAQVSGCADEDVAERDRRADDREQPCAGRAVVREDPAQHAAQLGASDDRAGQLGEREQRLVGVGDVARAGASSTSAGASTHRDSAASASSRSARAASGDARSRVEAARRGCATRGRRDETVTGPAGTAAARTA